MRYLFLIILISCTKISISQVHRINELKNQIYKSKDDEQKADLIGKLSYLYVNVDIDSTFAWSVKGIVLSNSLGYKDGEAASLLSLGRYYLQYGEMDSALSKMMQAKAIYENNKNVEGLALTYINLSIYFDYSGNHKEDYDYALKAKNILPFVKDTLVMIYTPIRLAAEYGRRESPKVVLNLAQESERLCILSKDTASWAVVLGYIGYAFERLNIPPGRLGCRQKALQLDLASGNTRGAAQNYLAIAREYDKLDKTDSALYFANLSYDIAINNHYAYIASDGLGLLASLLEGTDDKKALLYYKRFVEYSKASSKKQTVLQASAELDKEVSLIKEIAAKKIYRTRVLQFALLGCSAIFLAALMITIRSNKKKQKAYMRAEKTLSELKRTQSQLIQSEKMASLGDLTAGIAHEIQNPLNFVNNFFDVNSELVNELIEELKNENLTSVQEIAQSIKSNESKINYHGKKADSIVKSMLQHTRARSGKKEAVDLNAMADEYLKLAYHVMRARDKTFDARIETSYDKQLGTLEAVPQDIGRVFLNLINNAFYAVSHHNSNGEPAQAYTPTVSVKTRKEGEFLKIEIRDNGDGIQPKYLDRIFEPFFTTKPAGLGTGLGLSLSYDIVKALGGDITVETSPGQWCKFVVSLPA